MCSLQGRVFLHVACRDCWGTPAASLQLGLCQGVAVTPRDVTVWASPHLERRCHFGVKQFKLLEQVWGDSGSQIFHSLLFSFAKLIYFRQTHPLPLLLDLLCLCCWW